MCTVIERAAADGVAVAEPLVILVARVIGVAVDGPMSALVCVGVYVTEIVVIAVVVDMPAVRVGAARCVAAVGWIGLAVAAQVAVAGLRWGGDRSPVLARAPAAGRALSGGPVRRHQAEQGKQQASHAIHLLVWGLRSEGMGC
jgi:hypothetical protein